ncbi:MAG: 2'-5' RNA ligase family protein [Haloarculaceae archaeon]
MYSLNPPVPGDVARLATEVGRQLPSARRRQRGEHTLVCKRLVGDATYHELEARARDAVAGFPPFEARVARIDCFEDPPTGTAPVVYLAVESPGLEALHRRLCDAFDPVEGFEGEGYVPHVTVARGGSLERARDMTGDIDPVEWTVSELVFWDAERDQSVSRISLPA